MYFGCTLGCTHLYHGLFGLRTRLYSGLKTGYWCSYLSSTVQFAAHTPIADLTTEGLCTRLYSGLQTGYWCSYLNSTVQFVAHHCSNCSADCHTHIAVPTASTVKGAAGCIDRRSALDPLGYRYIHWAVRTFITGQIHTAAHWVCALIRMDGRMPR